MTWVPTYGRMSLVCDDCTETTETREVEVREEESHHEAGGRLWADAAPKGWRSRAGGKRHSCPACSGAEPW